MFWLIWPIVLSFQKPEILKEKKKKFGDDFSDRRLPMAHHPLMDKEARLGDLPVEDKIVLLKQELTADRISVFIHNYSFGTGADTFIWNFEPNFSHPVSEKDIDNEIWKFRKISNFSQ